MSEEERLVTELRLGHGSVELQRADKLLFTFHLGRCVHRINIVQGGVRRHRLQLRDVNHRIAALELLREQGVHILVRFEPQAEWEPLIFDLFSLLTNAGHVGQAYFLDEPGLGGEFSSENLQSTMSCTDMGGEVIGEEVPISRLTIDAVHRDKVGGVLPIPQEFEAHTRSKRLRSVSSRLSSR